MYIEPLSSEVENEIRDLVDLIRIGCHHYKDSPDFLLDLRSDFPVPFSLDGNIVTVSSSDVRKLLLARKTYAPQNAFDDFLSRRLKPLPGVRFSSGVLFFDLSEV